MVEVASPARRQIASAFLGRVGYGEGVALQERLVGELKAGRGGESLLLLEHGHVFTLGRNAPPGDLLATADWLAERGVEVHETSRGGRVTYHGPGQLVGYPILDLKPDRRDVRRYVRDLQEVLVRTVADFGVAAAGGGGGEQVGVWVGERKIASIGVRLSRWVTSHGFALNVATDLAYFAGISPCGFRAEVMTSLESSTGQAPDLEAVAERCATHFAEVFERRLLPGRERLLEILEEVGPRR